MPLKFKKILFPRHNVSILGDWWNFTHYIHVAWWKFTLLSRSSYQEYILKISSTETIFIEKKNKYFKMLNIGSKYNSSKIPIGSVFLELC